jgi:DNA-binding winged helix-turn-helix (wHTH) protein/tetratricopeptide (TPR) repeat protein
MSRRDATPDLGTLRFGRFALDAANQLTRGRESLLLPPKEAALLRLLAEGAGEPVSKSEILDALWTAEDVSDASLTRCVHQLRLALGDRRRSGAIQTLHGRGYRLTLPVHPPANDDTALEGPRVVIVPFEAGRAVAQRTLAVGLAGDVAERLGRLHGDVIAVIDPQSARQLGSDREALVRARRLGVDHLARGELHRAGRSLRVALELVALRDPEASWSQEFESAESAVAALAGEIAEAIAKRLGRGRAQVGAMRARAEPIRSKAYLALMQGHFESQLRTERGLRKGIERFEQAIAWDGRCAEAHAALADTHLMLAFRSYAAPRDVAPVVGAALKRALALDARLPAALVALAYLRLCIDRKPQAALEVLSRADATAEGNARVHWMYGMIHMTTARFDAAVAALDRSLELDPFSPNTIATRIWALVFGGRLDEALAAARAHTRSDPELALGHGVHAIAAALAGRHSEAARAAERAELHARGDQFSLGGAAWALGVVGRVEHAREIRGALERKSARRYVSGCDVAATCIGCGDRDGALAWLERAVAERCMFLPFVGVDPRFAPLRGDPRFRAIADLVGGRA